MSQCNFNPAVIVKLWTIDSLLRLSQIDDTRIMPLLVFVYINVHPPFMGSASLLHSKLQANLLIPALRHSNSIRNEGNWSFLAAACTGRVPDDNN
jgi:hypothetical protein